MAGAVGALRLGDLTVNFAERRVSLAGRPVWLTDIEYRVLFELSVNAGRMLSIVRCCNGSVVPRTPAPQGRCEPP